MQKRAERAYRRASMLLRKIVSGLQSLVTAFGSVFGLTGHDSGCWRWCVACSLACQRPRVAAGGTDASGAAPRAAHLPPPANRRRSKRERLPAVKATAAENPG